MVAVASGKGGVGKTSVAVALARELVRRGHRAVSDRESWRAVSHLAPPVLMLVEPSGLVDCWTRTCTGRTCRGCSASGGTRRPAR